ncbi:MAG: hypothetical protein M1450_02435 [Patescibacteria group bacterium]|nr:hypothetical protein [Patescibacteria group bacterium]
MTKKQIQELVLESFSNNNLDPEKVEIISRQLDRGELKEYIKALKKREKKNSVIVTLPGLPTDDDKKKFLDLFPNKKIIYNIDPSILVGVKIENNDLITELNLKDAIKNLAEFSSKTYD